MSKPYSNCRVIIDTFSDERLVMCFRLPTVFSVFSSGRVTFCSMSSAEAPLYDVITMMLVVSMSGNRFTGSFVSENTPSTTMAVNISEVIIGRLTAPSYRLIA